MRFASLALAATTLFVVTASAAFGQNITGNWNGRVDMSGAKLPKAQNAQMQAQMDQMLAMLKKVRFTLTLNKNKTFKMVVPPSGMTKTAQVAEGTWTQSGVKGTMTVTTENGKPAKKKESLPMVIAKDGKSISIMPPNSNGMGKMLFTR